MTERSGYPEATSHAHMHDIFIRCNYNATLKKSEDALQEIRTEKSSKETFG